MPAPSPDLSHPEGWLRALLNPRFACELILLGLPGRLRMPEKWTVEHASLPDHVFYFAAEGSFVARVNRRELRVAAGGLVWVPAGAPFHFWLPSGETLLVYRFRLRTAGSGRTAKEPLECGIYPAAWSCQGWIEQLLAEGSSADLFREERVRGLLLCLFTELARLSSDAGKQPGRLTRMQQEKLVHFFATHVRNRPRPAELAASLRLSPDYFTRLFRHTFNRPPRKWMMEQRVRLAALRLVESALNVSEVADEFGYPSVFVFSRQFKEVLGASPAHYRKQHDALAGKG